MVIGYIAHAAPMQMRFYDGTSLPADYSDDAFAIMLAVDDAIASSTASRIREMRRR